MEIKPQFKQEHHVELSNFSSLDEQILAEFLIKEKEDRPHYIKHEQWELLAGHKARYIEPKKYLETAKRLCCERKKQVDSYLGNRFIRWTLGVDREMLSAINTFSDSLQRRINCEQILYESIIAGAKQVSSAKNIDVQELVKTEEGRNQIFAVMFPSRNDYEKYCENLVILSDKLLDDVYDALKTIEPKLSNWSNKPFIGALIKQEWNEHRGKLPPQETSTEFFEAEIRYNKKRADQIYTQD
ncbi:MAG: hypothetical protein Q8P15_00305 [Nanoarchaeota archaeon]|nr:hypothetical protein [Nanoarchaeota archaeon]